MTVFLPDRFITVLRIVLVLTLSAAVSYYVAFSIHWPLLRDSSVMHYVNFLVDHGMRPYREISDNNLPGAYLADRFGVLVFGGGDLAWRFYDFFLLAVITASMVVIARPYDWLGGLFSGLMFALLHGSEGPDFPVEREEVVTALLLTAFAVLFLSLRRHRPSLLILFGFLAGMAGSIKPTLAPCGVVLLLAAIVPLQRRGERARAYLLNGFVGMSLACAVVLIYLMRHDAVRPLWFIVRDVLPSYVALNNKGIAALLRTMMPLNLLPIAAIAIALAAGTHRWNWERSLLLLGMLFGVTSYLAQRKGSIYHRYPFVAFLLLIVGLELMTALRRQGWPRLLGALGVIATIGLSVPHYLRQLRASPPNSTMDMALAMAADLRSLHGIDLQRNVECLDLTYGCFSALYRDNLVENNGFTGDLMLFSPNHSRAEDFYRDNFWRETQAHPPAVFVMSNEWFPQDLSFAKVDTWPEFRDYLQRNYTVRVRRSFPMPGQAMAVNDSSAPVPAYQLYIRNGSPLLASVPR